ncbi:MAG: DUF2232 domain-containing protein [Cyanobacteria bacterium]|jgi:uncharacterized protein YybS (DUF2232 family)|nr:DUF2232 domain-containing protein [Cyanobacteria bacterium GSL.Bin1]
MSNFQNDFDENASANDTANIESDELSSEVNWVDADEEEKPTSSADKAGIEVGGTSAVVMVETAFLASAAGLIWLINFYFPPGPLLRLLFPLPIALVYLRRGMRASWMSALIVGLLLSILMGPTRSILYVIPYGIMGIQLGACWCRRSSWELSIAVGAIIGTFGFFFRFWLLSIFLGEDLWLYVTSQIAQFLEWGFVQLGLLAQPSLWLVQAIALVTIILNSIIYVFAVHLVSLLILNRLGNPIPSPPHWVQVILDTD